MTESHAKSGLIQMELGKWNFLGSLIINLNKKFRTTEWRTIKNMVNRWR